MVRLHQRSTHRSLLLQLFNINSFQISLTRWFIFKNNTHSAAFLASPRLHPFAVCLTRQPDFRGAVMHRWSSDTSPVQTAVNHKVSHSLTCVDTGFTPKKSHPWTLSCLRQMCLLYVLNVYIFWVSGIFILTVHVPICTSLGLEDDFQMNPACSRPSFPATY